MCRIYVKRRMTSFFLDLHFTLKSGFLLLVIPILYCNQIAVFNQKPITFTSNVNINIFLQVTDKSSRIWNQFWHVCTKSIQNIEFVLYNFNDLFAHIKFDYQLDIKIQVNVIYSYFTYCRHGYFSMVKFQQIFFYPCEQFNKM